MGTAAFVYPDGTPSRFGYWYLALDPYIKSWQIYNCPSQDSVLDYANNSARGISFGYSYNYAYPKGGIFNSSNRGVSMGSPQVAGAIISSIDDPSQTIIMSDGSSVLVRYDADHPATESTLLARGTCPDRSVYYLSCLRARHLDTMNLLFVDGHAKSMQWQRVLGNPNDPNIVKFWTTASM